MAITANREEVTYRWINYTGDIYEALCNDGTRTDYYSHWPSPETSDWLHIVFASGGAAWRVTNDANDPYDLATRGSGLTGSGGAASTLDLNTKGGSLAESAVTNPDLYDSAMVWVMYRSSDLFTGLGTGEWGTAASQSYYFHGYANLRSAFMQILDDSRAEPYTKLLIGGRSAGGYGVMYNWKWLYDYAKAKGWETVRGYSDGAAPIDFYALDGYRENFAIESNRQMIFWRTPASGVTYPVKRPFDLASTTKRWTQEQAENFLIFVCQTDTSSLVYNGVNLSSLTAQAKTFAEELADRSREHALDLRGGTNIYSAWRAEIDGGDWETAHVLTGTDFWATELIPNLTPQEAMTLHMAGTPVYHIEEEGATITTA